MFMSGKNYLKILKQKPWVGRYIEECISLGLTLPESISHSLRKHYRIDIDPDSVEEYLKMKGRKRSSHLKPAALKTRREHKTRGLLEPGNPSGGDKRAAGRASGHFLEAYHSDIFLMKTEGHGACTIANWLRKMHEVITTSAEVKDYVTGNIDSHWRGRGSSISLPDETHGLGRKGSKYPGP